MFEWCCWWKSLLSTESCSVFWVLYWLQVKWGQLGVREIRQDRAVLFAVVPGWSSSWLGGVEISVTAGAVGAVGLVATWVFFLGGLGALSGCWEPYGFGLITSRFEGFFDGEASFFGGGSSWFWGGLVLLLLTVKNVGSRNFVGMHLKYTISWRF